jgi:tRNA-uridine 2-sulfurtransferase
MKAVGLLSGGLDSTLAAQLMIEQGIDVHAINFTSPFCQCTPKSSCCASIVDAVHQLGDIPLQRVVLGDDYLNMIASPRHGYGRGMNPCLDCRIMKLRKAGEYMREIGAAFLFTGEVLGQRPMSQHKRALALIDRDSGLGDVTVRPLSALHFEPTLPEREGWIDRAKLLSIQGRSRKEQIGLARDRGIADYPCPAGGCLLIDKNFAKRMRDYLQHIPQPRLNDIPLLKTGRHFRLPNGDKVIVARDEAEGKRLTELHRPDDHLLTPENFSGPLVLLQGSAIDAAIEKLLTYTRKLPEGDFIIKCKHLDSSFFINASAETPIVHIHNHDI